jgi:hypothetical protein
MQFSILFAIVPTSGIATYILIQDSLKQGSVFLLNPRFWGWLALTTTGLLTSLSFYLYAVQSRHDNLFVFEQSQNLEKQIDNILGTTTMF